MIAKDGSVIGTLKYVASWPEFNEGNIEEQSGNYFPLTLDKKYVGQDITVKKNGNAGKTVSETEWVLRIPDKETKFTFATNENDVFLTLNFSGSVLAVPVGKDAYDPDKKNFGRFGNWDTYCDTDVSIKWNGIKGTVTGKIKHHDEIHTVKAGYHFPLSMSSFYGDGVSKTITIGNGKPNVVTDKDIICNVENQKAIKVSYNGETVLELDLSGATFQPE